MVGNGRKTGVRALLRATGAATAAALVVGVGAVALPAQAAPGPALSAPAADIDRPDAGAAGAEWAALADGPQRYPEVAIERDVQITMSDGTVLKADVYRPAGADGAPSADTHPVI